MHIRRFWEDIMKQGETNSVLQKKIKKILREDYDGIYDFFIGILDKEYDYIILMSRRCLVLYQIFMIFFVLDEVKSGCTPIMISDQAIAYYRKQFRGKRVAIVDDILIHGRTISNIYESVCQYCGGNQPDIHVYMRDTNIDCLRDGVKKRLVSDCVAYKETWRNLSNRIVTGIYASNVPYTSFVTALFQYNNSTILHKLCDLDSLQMHKDGDRMQEKNGMTAYVFNEISWERPPIFQCLSQGECVRVYWNEQLSKLTVIPYVFVRSLSMDDANRIFCDIAENLPESMNQICRIFQETESDFGEQACLLEYKMRLLTCIMSNLYWNSLRRRYHLPDQYDVDIDTLDKSFGVPVANELQMFLDDEICFNCQYHTQVEILESKVNDELKLAMDNAYLSADRKDGYNFLKRYFQKAWYWDEYRALQGQERYKGLLLESFLDYAERFSIGKYKMLSCLINTWDTGSAATNYAADADSGLVGCTNTPGEQSYKTVLERNPYIMSGLIFVSKMISYSDAGTTQDDEKYRAYREQKLLDLLREMNHEHPIEDYQDIADIIKQEHGYMNAWNQIDIIQNYMTEDSYNYRDLVEKFIKSNF